MGGPPRQGHALNIIEDAWYTSTAYRSSGRIYLPFVAGDSLLGKLLSLRPMDSDFTGVHVKKRR